MRLRSRWLKVAAVMVVLIGGLWWLLRPRPQLEPRIFGTWRIGRNLDVTYSANGIRRQIHHDGNGRIISDTHTLWRVENGHLILVADMLPPTEFTRFKRYWSDQWDGGLHEGRHEILELTPTVFRTRYTEPVRFNREWLHIRIDDEKPLR
jgi:hypothetical protein